MRLENTSLTRRGALAFAGAAFGNVAEPQLVWFLGGEVAFDEIVVHRRTDLARSCLVCAYRKHPTTRCSSRSASRFVRPSALRRRDASSTRYR